MQGVQQLDSQGSQQLDLQHGSQRGLQIKGRHGGGQYAGGGQQIGLCSEGRGAGAVLGEADTLVGVDGA